MQCKYSFSCINIVN